MWFERTQRLNLLITDVSFLGRPRRNGGRLQHIPTRTTVCTDGRARWEDLGPFLDNYSDAINLDGKLGPDFGTNAPRVSLNGWANEHNPLGTELQARRVLSSKALRSSLEQEAVRDGQGVCWRICEHAWASSCPDGEGRLPEIVQVGAVPRGQAS